jgi:hypothetical protein
VAQDQGENVGFYLDLFDVQSEANNGMTIRIKYTVFSESRTLNEDF